MKINTNFFRTISFLVIFFFVISIVPHVQAQNASEQFSRNLVIGSRGEDVQRLQQFLNSHNFPVALSGLGSAGHETTYFGSRTRAALMLFQQHFADEILAPLGLKRPSGYFYTSTRNFINKMLLASVQQKSNIVQPLTRRIVSTQNQPVVRVPTSTSTSQTSKKSPNQTMVYAIGGNIKGLKDAVILGNNDETLTVKSGETTFKFPTSLAKGENYFVKIVQNPKDQKCYLGSGSSGMVFDKDILNIQIECVGINSWNPFAPIPPVGGGGGGSSPSPSPTPTPVPPTPTYTVGGTVTGLTGTVVLQNNGADNLTTATNGPFTFSTPVVDGASYNITVLTQPVGQTCNITNGSGTVGGSNVTNVGVNCTSNPTTIAVSVADLALSVNDTVTNAALTGNPRVITLTNTGVDPTDSLAITYPTWPTGTTASSTCGATLAPASSCTITITPGSTATTLCTTGIVPTPDVVSIAGTNTNTVTTNVSVLGYGCIYQGGYLFAMDDTSPNTGSVLGKVLAQNDQVSPPVGVIWSSDGSGGSSGSEVYDAIYGISATSTVLSPDPSIGQVLGQVACNGAYDGSCNTNNIYTYYQNFSLNAPINTSYYAAGVCKQTIDGYSDWYLPAICEMGNGLFCSVAQQNIADNLAFLVNNSNLQQFYWSSTEFSPIPDQGAHAGYYSVGLNGFDNAYGKFFEFGVRCARSLT